jgi:hypothetical protein
LPRRAEIVNKLNKEVNAALDDPKMKARLADLGGTPLPGSPGVAFGAPRPYQIPPSKPGNQLHHSTEWFSICAIASSYSTKL